MSEIEEERPEPMHPAAKKFLEVIFRDVTVVGCTRRLEFRDEPDGTTSVMLVAPDNANMPTIALGFPEGWFPPPEEVLGEKGDFERGQRVEVVGPTAYAGKKGRITAFHGDVDGEEDQVCDNSGTDAVWVDFDPGEHDAEGEFGTWMSPHHLRAIVNRQADPDDQMEPELEEMVRWMSDPNRPALKSEAKREEDRRKNE